MKCGKTPLKNAALENQLQFFRNNKNRKQAKLNANCPIFARRFSPKRKPPPKKNFFRVQYNGNFYHIIFN